MNVNNLIKQLQNMPGDLEVFIRCARNPTGNIVEAKKAALGEYGFFGLQIEYVIIEADKE